MCINTCIWNLEKWYWWTYLQGRNRDTDVENGLVETAEEQKGGTNWESSIDKYTLSIKQRASRKIPWMEELDRLQSMGSLKSPAWLSDFTFTFHFHALEKEMATHSSIPAWRIPGMEEPGGLPSMGSHRVRHDWSDLAAAAAAVGSYIAQATQPGSLWWPGEMGWRSGMWGAGGKG